MSVVGAWISVLLMMILVIYFQIMLKIRILAAGEVGAGIAGITSFLIRLLLDPWIWTCIAAAVVGLFCWMAAMSRLSLSAAYPFVALMIAGVLLANTIFLGEPFRLLHMAGIALIALGLLAISYA